MTKLHTQARNEEINLVRKLNQMEQSILKEIFSLKGKDFEQTYIYAVHSTKKRPSKIHSRPVYPKADVFLAASSRRLKLHNLYLTDQDISSNDIVPVPYTGISVKLAQSSSYTIIKMSPSTFEKVIGSRILGAAASIYDKNPQDFSKNIQVLSGWGVSTRELKNWVKHMGILKSWDEVYLQNPKILKLIKKKALLEIKNTILNNQNLKQKLFWGIDLFPEPYSAHYFFYQGKLARVEDVVIDFSVTTGSGRSKGIYTIVLKPQGKPVMKNILIEL